MPRSSRDGSDAGERRRGCDWIGCIWSHGSRQLTAAVPAPTGDRARAANGTRVSEAGVEADRGNVAGEVAADATDAERIVGYDAHGLRTELAELVGAPAAHGAVRAQYARMRIARRE